MSKVKAHLLIAALEYINNNYSKEEVRNVLDKLNPEDRAIVSKKIVPLAWLPVQVFNNLLETADYVLSKGNYYICREIGRYQAEKGINSFYKMFIKIGNPAFAIKRTPSLWRSLHDEGELMVEVTGDKSARARLLHYPEARKTFCNTLIGCLEKALEISGAKDVQIFETKCQAKGDKFCEFIGNWE